MIIIIRSSLFYICPSDIKASIVHCISIINYLESTIKYLNFIKVRWSKEFSLMSCNEKTSSSQRWTIARPKPSIWESSLNYYKYQHVCVSILKYDCHVFAIFGTNWERWNPFARHKLQYELLIMFQKSTKIAAQKLCVNSVVI